MRQQMAYCDDEWTIKQARVRALRSYLPYGKWTCLDGREVLFNRAYKPIWERRGRRVAIADPMEWIRDIKHEEWFFDDLTAPWETFRGCKNKLRDCIKILKAWGVFGPNAEHQLIGPDRVVEFAVIPGGKPAPEAA